MLNVPELLYSIFSYLPISDRLSCTLVCKTWNFYANDELFWKTFAKDLTKNTQLSEKTISNLTCQKHTSWKGVVCRHLNWNKQKNPSFHGISPQIVQETLHNRLEIARTLGLHQNLENEAQLISILSKSHFLQAPDFTFSYPIASNFSYLKLLVGAGFNIFGKNDISHTVFHKAILEIKFCAFSEKVEFLVGKKGNINARDSSGNTVLHKLIYDNSYPDRVSYLIENGASLKEENESLFPPLHLAARLQRHRILRNLLNYCSPDMQNSVGKTALHIAATIPASNETLKILLQKRANINCEDFQKRTPLHLALIYENLAAAFFFITKWS